MREAPPKRGYLNVLGDALAFGASRPGGGEAAYAAPATRNADTGRPSGGAFADDASAALVPGV